MRTRRSFAAIALGMHCALIVATGAQAQVGTATRGSTQSSTESVRPPRAVYMGIELLRSTEQVLFATLGHSEASALLNDLDEVNEGYCYVSPQGISVAFRRDAATYDTVELSRKPIGLGCKRTSVTLDHCVGPLCLGATREEVERHLGRQLTPATEGEMQARYEYELPMSAAQLKAFARFEITNIPVTHVIWVKFEEKRLDFVRVWREEHLP